MKAKMKAWRIYGPLDMRLDQIDTPVAGESEILVKIGAVGICATDIELYDGSMPYIRQGLTKLPLIPGHEWSGTVASVGAQVTGFKEGDKVVGDISLSCGACLNCLRGSYHLCDQRSEVGIINKDGAFAEYLAVPAKHVYHVPAGVSLEEAAFVEPAATCVNAVKRTVINLGDRVVVFGDGVIGFLSAEAALAGGASKVALIARKSDHREVAASLGMELIDSSKEDIYEAVKSRLGDLPELVVEATGKPEVFNQSVYMVKPGGRLSALSITGKETLAVDMDYIVTRDISVVGSLASPNSFDATLRLMQEKKLSVKPLMSKIFSSDEALEAFEYVRLRKGPRIKVLVTFS